MASLGDWNGFGTTASEQLTPTVKVAVVAQANSLPVVQRLVEKDSIIHSVKCPGPYRSVRVDEVFHLNFAGHVLGVDLQAVAHGKVAVDHQAIVKKTGVKGHIQVPAIAVGQAVGTAAASQKPGPQIPTVIDTQVDSSQGIGKQVAESVGQQFRDRIKGRGAGAKAQISRVDVFGGNKLSGYHQSQNLVVQFLFVVVDPG